jgi:hypothetical protein
MSKMRVIEANVFGSVGGESPWPLYKIDRPRPIDRYIDYFGATAEQTRTLLDSGRRSVKAAVR